MSLGIIGKLSNRGLGFPDRQRVTGTRTANQESISDEARDVVELATKPPVTDE